MFIRHNTEEINLNFLNFEIYSLFIIIKHAASSQLYYEIGGIFIISKEGANI